MKLSTIYSKIKCLFRGHDWKYNNPKDEILFDDNQNFIGSFRFCKNCCKKEKRCIFDLGRGMVWVKTKEYTKQELREINLRELLE
jgi:hypothetical protein